MAFHWCDNVHTTSFTPRDYQVELLASASEQNTMLCLGHKSSKEFIALKLLQEKAKELRENANKLSLYLARLSGESAYNLIYHLTDLKVYNEAKGEEKGEPIVEFGEAQVLILRPKTCLIALRNGDIKLNNVNLIILEDCHEIQEQTEMFALFKEFYSKSDNTPKVLALAGPLHSAGCAPEDLNAMLEILEKRVNCKAETASDIVTVLRYCTKPTEFILQCAPPSRGELTTILEEIVCTRKAFLNDHRYDPSEIYSDEFLEELKGIPDPKTEPTQFLNIYLESLYEMGPWCADRVALSLIHQIEKQKVKTPYERHYLLLCLVITALFEIHTLCEQAFNKISSEKERVEKYSSPKVLRLLEILKLFKPDETISENEQLGNITKEIEKLNFHKLKQSLENTFQVVENLSKSISKDIIENLDPILKPTHSNYQNNYAISHENNQKNVHNQLVNSLKNRRNQNIRHKKRPFARRHNRDAFGDPDALCGIIFCNSKYTARVLFDLLAEMSRHDSRLKFLKCQFTTDRIADPIAEPKEAELEHRRQEDVLKRFRIHDCNLLIGTSVLEEGIDLPKCNLVIRWNPPTTYRSYVQCKGRARASQAYHIILVAPNFSKERYTCASESLSDKSHRVICTESAESAEKYVNKDVLLHNDIINSVVQPKPIIIEHSSGASVKILNPEVIARSLAASVSSNFKNNTDKSSRISDITYESVNNAESTLKADNLNESTESKKSTDSTRQKILKTSDFESSYELVPISDITGSIGLNITAQEIIKPLSNGGLGADDLESPEKDADIEYKCVVDEAVETADAQSENSIQEMENATNEMVDRLAQYREIEKMLLQKCANTEPGEKEHQEADRFTNCIAAYKPLPELLTGAMVDLSTSIALINKYCAKLPSDTFTKLTPLSRCAKTKRCGIEMYQYTLRLPINSPLKYDIVGLPMPTKILARRMVALQACRELHLCGELDNTLQPIGKEGFKAFELDWEDFELEQLDEQIVTDNAEPRPGTTKRRQYYYKRIASEFSNCRPTAGAVSYLYHINLTLQCPIPEEQNTRGRKIYPPEEALQGFGILTLKKIPKVSAFPIFTRSGEVKVSIDLSKKRIVLTEDQVARINTFVNYTFSNVLRLQKFLMLFDVDSTENCVFIVPTIKRKNSIVIDWDFLEEIAKSCNMMPQIVPDEVRKNKEFDANKFKDAVVMPWYRNQDQPQYFYVAEICPHLTPLSCFPGENYNTFKHYYLVKYGITIQNVKQPLLDVDHTSARLNFLTPRYVNRKGVALPTSSEETKRAKRENLEQKQILVPELCTIHPFPASLWRTAVCLPCILYRVNGLLLADEIRKKVSYDIGLGCMEIDRDDFEWPILDFGWSLAEVLKKNKEMKAESTPNEETKPEIKLIAPIAVDVKIEKLVSKEESKVMLEEPEVVKVEKKSANEIVLEGEEKLKADTFIEIGTWSNDMANSMSEEDTDMDDDEFCSEFLPPNVSFCKTDYDIIKSDKPTRYGSPTFWDVEDSMSSKLDGKKNSSFMYGSDDSFNSNYDYDDEALSSSTEENDGPLRIEFTSDNVAEAIETEDEKLKRQKQLSIIQDTIANERNYQVTKNLQVGYNFDGADTNIESELKTSEEAFILSTEKLKKEIHSSGMLVRCNQVLSLPKKQPVIEERYSNSFQNIKKLFPYIDENELLKYLLIEQRDLQDLQLTITDVENLNKMFLQGDMVEKYNIDGDGDIFDSFNDSYSSIVGGKKEVLVNFDRKRKLKIQPYHVPVHMLHTDAKEADFSFDHQPKLLGHPGPSPSIILQGLTMSNANDGINLERLETIGDSFLKYAITTYLYITYENVHEGKLSHLRSKQVANLNLYRLGRKKMLGECMIATKFEPHDNWLPPCYYVPRELEKTLIKARIPPHHWKLADLPNIKQLSSEELCELVRKKAEKLGQQYDVQNGIDFPRYDRTECLSPDSGEEADIDFTSLIPYNLVTQHSIPDKSVADCVEALIGAYLIECGPRGALLFMAWLGIRVLPIIKKEYDSKETRIPGSTRPTKDNSEIIVYGSWSAPKSPLLEYAPNPRVQLESLLDGYSEFETAIGYSFNDRSYLLQAMTHASYSPNRLTDCYQRLEFLGDAVLDYLITRHLYEDPRQHSPGALTDLRSALVNNTIFASLAVRHGFHKYFRHLSPGLNEVIDRFVRIQHENGHSISEEYYLLSEEECDDAEDVEVPKALGDVFESIAGAIFLDSNMSLDTVWRIYSNMMKPEIEQFSNSVPKSPIRELLELEPETAKFGKPEKLADGRRVRVTVEVFCKGTFRGIGRNYRIAKCTAAKCALRQLKKQGHISKKH